VSYSIHFRPGVERDMSRLPANVVRRIDKTLLALQSDPRMPGTRKLTGTESLYRARIGDYRIVDEIDDSKNLVDIQIVAHRREVYRVL